MSYHIHFPKLGIMLTKDTPAAEVKELAAKYPAIKRAIALADNDKTMTDGEAKK